ncbi:MAG: sugar ABC transporter substrate-binding protein [Limnochordaceae bacterium]|nr:sugar ABC transporter substrate-binding protein [Limnochordaceae bacterium]
MKSVVITPRWGCVAKASILSAALAVLAACSSYPGLTSRVAAAAAQGGKVTVTVWTSASGPYPQIQAKLARDLAAKYPEITVKLDYVDWTQIQAKLLVGVAGGSAPDMVLLPTRYAPAFIEQHLVVPVDHKALSLASDADIPKLFLPGVASALDFGSKFYFLPTELTWLGMYYNKDMLDAAGIGNIPDTWEEVGQIGSKFTRIGPKGVEQAGLTIGRWGPFTAFWFLSFIRSAGQDWIKDGQPNFSNPQCVAALQVYADLYNRYRAAVASFDGQENFEASKIAFMPGLSVALVDFRKRGKLPFELGVSEYPHLATGRPANIAYAWGYFVLASSKHQEEAWKVANEFTSPENAPYWFKTGSLFVPRGQEWVSDMPRTDSQLRTLMAGLSHATMELAHPKYDDIVREINRASDDMVLHGLGAASAMAELDSRLAKILRQ